MQPHFRYLIFMPYPMVKRRPNLGKVSVHKSCFRYLGHYGISIPKVGIHLCQGPNLGAWPNLKMDNKMSLSKWKKLDSSKWKQVAIKVNGS